MGEFFADITGLNGGEYAPDLYMMTEDDMRESTKDLKKRINGRRALSLVKIGERHPSLLRKNEGSIPLKAKLEL